LSTDSVFDSSVEISSVIVFLFISAFPLSELLDWPEVFVTG